MKKNIQKVLVLLAIPLIAASCTNKVSSDISNSNNNSNQQTSGQGSLRVLLGNATSASSTISSVVLNIDKIEIHGQQDWLVATDTPRQIDLMRLGANATSTLVVETQIPAGTYDQIRLHITGVNVTSSGRQVLAKLPSSTLKIIGKIVINANSSTTAELIFDANKSLHSTGNGIYIFTPVLKFKSSGGGAANSEESLGTDENGETKENFILDDKNKFDVTASGTIHLINGKDEAGLKINAQKASEIAIQNQAITTSISVKLETKDGKKVWNVTGLKDGTIMHVYIDANAGTIIEQ